MIASLERSIPRVTTSVTLFLGAMALSGCALFTGIPKPPQTSNAVSPAAGFQLGPDAVRGYNQETDPARKKALRNEIIDARMAEIDHKFGDFERELYQDGIGAGIGTDWTVLALTTASTLSTHAPVKSLLSGLSGFVVGANGALDKRVLFDKALPALLAQMVAGRETARASIRTNERLSVDDYTWFAAESDLQSFLFVGSLPGAISSVAEDAGKKASAAREELKALTKDKYAKTATSEKIEAFWKPGGVVNAEHRKEITDWMSANGFDTQAGSITMFVHGQMNESARAELIKKLGI